MMIRNRNRIDSPRILRRLVELNESPSETSLVAFFKMTQRASFILYVGWSSSSANFLPVTRITDKAPENFEHLFFTGHDERATLYPPPIGSMYFWIGICSFTIGELKYLKTIYSIGYPDEH